MVVLYDIFGKYHPHLEAVYLLGLEESLLKPPRGPVSEPRGTPKSGKSGKVARDGDGAGSDVLSPRDGQRHEQRKKQVLALGRLSWSLRPIEQETGDRRETASR